MCSNKASRKTTDNSGCFNTPSACCGIVYLKKYELKFSALDLTEDEAKHWRKKVAVLVELKPEFEKEGNLNLYNYRYSEAVRYANWDMKKRSRYLYHISLS